eukprot:7073409-Pyramimonas_sp.AAC.2
MHDQSHSSPFQTHSAISPWSKAPACRGVAASRLRAPLVPATSWNGLVQMGSRGWAPRLAN